MGVGELFENMGAVALDGGGTMNPSTYELLAGIHDVPGEEVVVLPNSPNVIMAAERAAELAEKAVHVVPSRSMQAGLAAVVALDPGRGAAGNAAAMNEALEHVRTGAVTHAARDDVEGRFRRGDAVGFVDEQIVAWGEPGETLEAVLGELAAGRAADADRGRARRSRLRRPRSRRAGLVEYARIPPLCGDLRRVAPAGPAIIGAVVPTACAPADPLTTRRSRAVRATRFRRGRRP